MTELRISSSQRIADSSQSCDSCPVTPVLRLVLPSIDVDKAMLPVLGVLQKP
jgi:hypothetical protein